MLRFDFQENAHFVRLSIGYDTETEMNNSLKKRELLEEKKLTCTAFI